MVLTSMVVQFVLTVQPSVLTVVVVTVAAVAAVVAMAAAVVMAAAAAVAGNSVPVWLRQAINTCRENLNPC
jgi:hypothetical protein